MTPPKALAAAKPLKLHCPFCAMHEAECLKRQKSNAKKGNFLFRIECGNCHCKTRECINPREAWQSWDRRIKKGYNPIIPHLAQEGAWRPIASAPRDGTMLLVWDGKNTHTAYWGRFNPINDPAWIGGHCHVSHIDQPTHWQPLPPPPTGEGEKDA